MILYVESNDDGALDPHSSFDSRQLHPLFSLKTINFCLCCFIFHAVNLRIDNMDYGAVFYYGLIMNFNRLIGVFRINVRLLISRFPG